MAGASLVCCEFGAKVVQKKRPTKLGLIYAEKRSIYAEKRLNMRRKAQKNAGAICCGCLGMFGV